MIKKVLGIISLAGVVGVFSGIGCTATLVSGGNSDAASDTSPGPGPTPTTSSNPDASKPKTDGSTSGACFDEEGALSLVGIAPVRGAGKCTDTQITELEKQCLDSDAGCDAFIAANKDCARCILGALKGDDDKTTPIGALIPVSETDVAPNTASCAAIVIGRPDCAAKLAIQEVCLASSCSLCESKETDDACQKEAAAGICKTVMDAACTQAVESRASEWQAQCNGADFASAYPKVARFLCGGATSTDAGGGG